MLPVNVEKECKDILATGKFKTKKYKYKEMLMVGRYLHTNGMSDKFIENQWKKIWLNENSYTKVQEDFELNKFLKAIKKPVAYNIRRVKVYQQEIDYINSKWLPIWAKQYVLLFLVTCKICRVDRLRKEIRRGLLGKTDAKRQRENTLKYVTSELDKCGLLVTEVDDVYNSTYGFYTKKYYSGVPFMKNEGIIAFEAEDMDDVVPYFYLLKNFKKCPKCGKVFECSFSSQTDLCHSCWEKKEIKRKYELNKKTTTPSKEAICVKCGKIFMKSSKSKTDLCYECLKKQNNEKALNRMRKLRCSGENRQAKCP